MCLLSRKACREYAQSQVNKQKEDWKIDIIDTGKNTMTGGRLKRVEKYVGDDDFFFTYGDGLSNVNLNDLLKFHK